MARGFILKSMTKPKEGCYYCSLETGICYHRLVQMPEHLCFCLDECFGGSFTEICKLQTYEERQKMMNGESDEG